MYWLVTGLVLLCWANLWAADEEAKKPASDVPYEIIQRPMTADERQKYGIFDTEAGYMNFLTLPGNPERYDLPPARRSISLPVDMGLSRKGFSLRKLGERGVLLLAQWETDDRSAEHCDVIGVMIFQKDTQSMNRYHLLLQNHVPGGWYSSGHPAWYSFRANVEVRYLEGCNILLISHARHHYDYTDETAPFAEATDEGEEFGGTAGAEYASSVTETTIFQFSVQPGKLVPVSATSLIDTKKNGATLEELNRYLAKCKRPAVKDGFHGFPHVLKIQTPFTFTPHGYLEARQFRHLKEESEKNEGGGGGAQ